MTLIVEDGTGLSDAESYASVTYADTYHYNRGNTDWSGFSTAAKEQLLRKATDYMLQKYRGELKGTRVSDSQALDEPRDGVYIDNNVLVSNSIVPKEFKNATCELALRSNDGELLEDSGGRLTTKEKVDVIEVEYSDKGGTSSAVIYGSVDKMLKPYLEGGSVSGMVGRVERA